MAPPLSFALVAWTSLFALRNAVCPWFSFRDTPLGENVFSKRFHGLPTKKMMIFCQSCQVCCQSFPEVSSLSRRRRGCSRDRGDHLCGEGLPWMHRPSIRLTVLSRFIFQYRGQKTCRMPGRRKQFKPILQLFSTFSSAQFAKRIYAFFVF